MHDDEPPACSAGAGPAHCRREVRPLTQSVTCRQHAAASGGSGRELGAALAAAGGEDGAAGTRAHTKAEAVRLGAATVVRLEGALAHEVLRRLQGPVRRHDDVGAAPVWGWWWPTRPQSASPWRAEVVRLGRARGHGHAKEVADTLGQRYGSRREGVKPTGAAPARTTKPTILERPSAIARRHAVRPEICGRRDCHQQACGCRFSTLTIFATPCTGCGQRCGQQGIVHQTRTGPAGPTRRTRAPARREPSRETQQVQRN
jgi:hypothetical protein